MQKLKILNILHHLYDDGCIIALKVKIDIFLRVNYKILIVKSNLTYINP
ncbi:MAG: hypothetical protein ACJAX4_004390 [Clostridium sp.]|jgi:hypothetical protein